MRLAVPNCRGRISPVFDVARRYRVIDVDYGMITDQADHVVCGDPCRELIGLAVDQVICAGVSRELQRCLEGLGVVVLAGYCGIIDEVVDAHLCGSLDHGAFNMPGSPRRRPTPAAGREADEEGPRRSEQKR
ncbi:MAG: hypothetical protein V2I67_08400 [Thermoanaerobaculales bacterium]|jgi:predicted Fe-Mo cluster-binding NifX family protein|nr:hypothetical protein [Thermoanaerobaculales bacterium]